MYLNLLLFHSLIRWLVILFMLVALFKSWDGLLKGRVFSKTDDRVRHWTATVAHLQMMIGIVLYAKSPVVNHYWSGAEPAGQGSGASFFPLIHLLLMLIAIVVLTIGSAKAKRMLTDHDKFKTMAIWFTISIILIMIAIPWPFSPLSQRPFIRTF